MEHNIAFNKQLFINQIQKQVSSMKTSTLNSLKSMMHQESKSKINDGLDNFSKNFKEKVTVISNDGSDIPNFPEKIYEAVMQQVVAVKAPELSNDSYQFVNSIMDYVGRLLDTKNQVITVSGVKYKISTEISPTLGLAKVTVNNKDYIFSWDSTKTKETVNDFVQRVAEFGKENIKSTIVSATIDTLIDKWIKVLTEDHGDVAYEIFQELSELKDTDVVGAVISTIYEKIKSNSLSTGEAINALLELTNVVFPENKNAISDITNAYKSIDADTTALKNYINNSSFTTESLEKSSEYKKFVSTYNKLQSLIGGAGWDLDDLIAYCTITRFSNVNNETISVHRASIEGTSKDDTINVKGSDSTVDTGYGNDILNINASNVVVINKGGNDSIEIYGNKSYVNGNGVVEYIVVHSGTQDHVIYTNVGEDTIIVHGHESSIYAGEDNDRIFVTTTNNSSANSNKIYGGTGGDTVVVQGALYNTLSGDDGNDFIAVQESSSWNTITGGYGNDTILLVNSDYSYIAFGLNDGQDSIVGLDDKDTLFIDIDPKTERYTSETVGNDVIIKLYSDSMSSYSSSITLKDGAGKSLNIKRYYTFEEIMEHLKESEYELTPKTISSWKDNKFDNAILNADYSCKFKNYGSNVTINNAYTIDGASSIYSSGSNVIIQTGIGNDTIDNHGDNVRINAGNGKDYIQSYGANATINGNAGNDSIYNDGKNVVIDSGIGNDTIKSYGDNVIINSGYGNDVIYNSRDSVKTNDSVRIISGDGNDSISNSGANVTINAGEGDDSIYNEGDSVTIDGGAGNDSIYNYSVSSAIINGGTGDDYVSGGSNSTIDGGDGNDSISGGYESKIVGGNGNDYISGSSNSTIDGGEGDDSIANSGSSVSINGGFGNDSIYNSGDSVTIDGGLGDDSIYNQWGDSVTIDSGEGNDYIYNEYGKNVTIDGGTGEDYISNSGDSVSINAGEGEDYISNSGDSVSINAGEGEDYISNSGDSVSINAGEGNDYISLSSESRYALIQYNSGDGNDTIYGINGNDTIQILGSDYSTSVSGKDVILKVGNSSMTLVDSTNILVNVTLMSGENYRFKLGSSDNDSIYNEGDSVMIDEGAGNDSVHNYHGDSVTIDGGEGNDYIYNHSGYLVSINSGEGDDYIRNNLGDSVTIDGGAGNDYIYNYGYLVSINSGEGDDSVYNYYGDSVTIDGGAGNDSIYNLGDSVTIDGGLGDDSIYNNLGDSVTIDGGAGNDYISLSSESHYALIHYNSDDGNDTIYGLNSDDTLKITGAKYSTLKSGNNLIIGVGSGKITIVGGANVDFTIDTLDSGNTDTISSDTLPAGISINNSILIGSNKFTGNKIDLSDYKSATKVDASSLSKGVSIVGSPAANSIKGGSGADTISGNAGNDTVSLGGGNDTVSLGGGNDVYIYSSGDDLIQDYTSGQDKIKLTSGSISSASVSNSNVILNISNGGKITIQNGKDKEITFIDSKGNEKTQIYHSNDKTEPTDSLQAGMSVKSSVLTASNKFIGNKIDLANYPTVTKVNASTVLQAVNIVGNSSANSIKGGKGADTISGGFGNDTLIGGTGKDLFVYSSGNDVITDYKVGEDKIKIGSITKSSVKGSDVILTTSNGNLTVKGAKDKVVTLIDSSGKTIEKIFFADTSYTPLETGLTYDAKRTVLTASTKFKGDEIDLGEYLETVAKVNTSAISKSVDITGNSADNSIKGGKGADTISGGNGKDTILGGAGNDSISGGNDNDKLQGDAGNDTLNGGNGNDTLTGGAGNDVFVYQGGNDIITDYKPNEDKIKLNPSAITNSSVKGSDVILITSNGNLTVKATKDKVITFVDDNGKTTDKIFFGDTSYAPLATGLTYDAKRVILTASNKFTGNKIDLGEYLGTVTKVNASAVNQALNIVGNSAANSIKGGKSTDTINGGVGKDTILGGAGNDSISGGNDNDKLQGDAGNDTLNGGNGNDTLTGGAGNDVFVYQGGNDLITDYKVSEDKIKIGSITKSSVKGSDVILTTSNGNLTVKGAKDKVITFVDNNGKTTEKIFYADTSYEPLATGLTYDAKRMVLTASNKFTGNKIDLGEYLGTVTKVNASAVNQALNIVGNSAGNSINGGKSTDTINGGVGKDTILGGAGNDSIYGGNDNDKLQGDTGNDTLNGGLSNDTLTGGAGNDVFVYEGGNDVITDYKPNEDTIKLLGNTVTASSLSGSNVILKTSGGNITVQNGKNKKITVIDSSGTETTQIYPTDNLNPTPISTLPNGWKYGNNAQTNMTASVSSATNVDLTQSYGTNIVTVDGSKVTKNISITGNEKANVIKGGSGADVIYGGSGADKLYGNDGNDSLYGGAGNDTLIGGSGRDAYIYNDGDGNDVIEDFDSQSTLKISGNGYSTIKSGNDVIVKVGNGSINLIGAASFLVNIVGTLLGGNTDEIGKNIENQTSNTLLSGTSGDDSIYNDGDSVTIDAGVGNDSIYTYGDSVTIDSGAGNDSIYNNNSKNMTINAGTGNDSIQMIDYSKNTKIQYSNGDGNDTIDDFDSNDIIQILDGNYTTLRSGNDFIISVGSGSIILKRVLLDSYNKIHIQDSKGNMSVYNDWGSVINGTSANDNFKNYTNLVSIETGEGNDNVFNIGNNVTINTGTGNDSIYNQGESVTIDLGAGDDTIWNDEDRVTIKSGMGNDSVYNQYADFVSIVTSYGDDSIHILNSNHIMIQTGSDKDSIYNDGGKNVTIDSGEDNDFIITGYKSKFVTINAGNGNDTIRNGNGENVAINADDGNDKIENYGENVTINAGAGNDSIYSDYGSSNVTLNSGTGDDYISLYSSVKNTKIQYANGDGNDIIYGIKSTDTLQISNAKYITTKSGSDLIVGVGSGKITVVGGANVDFTIDGNYKNEILDNANECIFDLLYDNNFVADEFGIDDISEVTETNYSVGKLEHFSNNNELVNDSIFSASSFDKKS